MQQIWGFDGVRVVVTGIVHGSDPAFEGFAEINGRVYEWEGYPKPEGYVVKLDGSRNGVREYQGTTFNLGLEVAGALKE